MRGSWSGGASVRWALVLMLSAVTAAGGRSSEPPEKQLEHATGLAIVDAIRSHPLLSGPQSLAHIELTEGFEVQLVASEPLIRDPVAFDWGPDGRLWVAEMADYPFNRDGSQRPGGRIQVLEDRDGDGVYDHATLFADGLSTPTGLLLWRGGLLVTACPDILYLEDTNGDGRADRIEKLYSGFAEGNQQHRVNGLAWGLDNWIYVANGDSGGRVVSHRTGEAIDIRGRDLRIRPDSGQLEVQAGQTQFGRNRDDWGDWFSCNNPNPIFHFVLEEHYLRRNPHVVPPEIKRNILVGGTDLFPIGPIISHCDPIHRPLGASPHFTAACSTIVYRDELFGPDYHGVTFTSDPVYNLVHARRLEPDGVSFRSHRLLPEGQEFFRSSDPWSRPTMLQVGPDGGLYIADMVREVIEHPEWIDPKLRTEIDMHSGDSFGRIYRVVPSGSRRRAVPDLGRMTPVQLVEHLDSASGWQRDLVHRLLVWKADPSVVPSLEALAGSDADPRSRLQALAILDGLEALSPALLALIWDDAHPQLRRHAIRLSESLLTSDPDLAAQVDAGWEARYRTRLHDPSPVVRVQLAYSLGGIDTPWAAELLATLALRDQHDPIILAAIISSLRPGNIAEALERLVAEPPATQQLIGQLLAISCRMGVPESLDRLLDADIGRLAILDRLDACFESLGPARRQLESLLGRHRCEQLYAWLEAVGEELPPSDLDRRAASLRLSGLLSTGNRHELQSLASYLTANQPPQLQRTAAATLIEVGSDDVPPLLTAGWPEYTPQLRAQVLDALMTRPTWGSHLLQELEAGSITLGQLSAAQRDQLLQHPQPEQRQRFEQLLGRSSRQLDQVLQRYADAIPLALDGQRDAAIGRSVFQQRCASCHRLDGVGGEVGPDLGSLANRSPPAILTAIVDPNRAIEARYLQYQVLTTDGQVLTGLLAEETTHSLRLVSAEGKVIELLRSSVEQLRSTERSMMPEGLEEELSVTHMADLIHYVMDPSGGDVHAINTIAEPARP